jgi:hypothetical protein
LYSVTTLVPINDRIKSWEKTTPPSDWATYRRRWDLHHRWRVVLLTTAFAFLIVGLLHCPDESANRKTATAIVLN